MMYKQTKIACGLFVLMACVLASCSDNRRSTWLLTGEEADTTSVDSADVAQGDSLMPTGADELFDDFFFNYATSHRQQQERTVFPLPVITDGKKLTVERRQWKMEPFFMNQDYYTLIFDSSPQEDLVHDTTLVEATVERFNLDTDRVEQFVFSRRSGRWMLHEVRRLPLQRNANAQFLKFYQQFASDSVFQHASLAQQIIFSGPDPDDDFSTIEGMITPDFWEAFRPELPQHILYNIVYGQQNPASTHKIMLLRGIANGLEVELTFHLRKGHWILTKLIT
ncbi:MAG: DUF4348 domain-containing protein [Prevotella sp.]|nr:DUF4348 domain-containing protein [Prevotella sp.]